MQDGGSYFNKCLDATLHLQRGLAHIFPGRLRHWGLGLRFLSVGFQADKNGKRILFKNNDSNAPDSGMTAHLSSYLTIDIIRGTKMPGVIVALLKCQELLLLY
jgi:hypothetical protein